MTPKKIVGQKPNIKFFQVAPFVAHCAGRHLRTKLMAQYIGSGQKKRFDVGIQELVSKVQKNGPLILLRKKVF